MNLEQYLIPAEEGYIFSTKDLESNLDLWKPGPHNILYIIGLSASGKTTLSNAKVASTGATHIETDNLFSIFNHELGAHDDEIYAEAYATYFNDDEKNIMKNFFKRYSIDKIKRSNAFISANAVIKSAIEYCHSQSNHLFIIDDVIIFEDEDDFFKVELMNNPLIIKNTSMLKSLYQRYRREGSMGFAFNGETLKDRLRNLIGCLQWYFRDEAKLRQRRRMFK